MKRLIALAAFQIVAMLGWAAQNEYLRATAPTFRIPLRATDPSQVRRGRSFLLTPRDGQIKTGEEGVALTAEDVKRFLGAETAFVGAALVGFCPQGEVHRVCAVARLGETRDTAGRYWSRAHVSTHWEDSSWSNGRQVTESGYRLNIDLALDRFFLPNRVTLPAPENEPGWEVEVCHRPGLTPLPKRLFFKGQPVVAD